MEPNEPKDMRPEKAYHKLIIWRKANDFVIAVYKMTANFPKDEAFGLTSQLRRATISIAANIVEGQARGTRKDFVRFLYISRGSLSECEYYLELALELKFINQDTFNKVEQLREEVGFLLHKLINSLK